MNADRVRLSILLRRTAPALTRALAREAARASQRDEAAVDSLADRYALWIGRSTPRALDAIAADDVVRARLLASLTTEVPPGGVEPIPPVARVGLMRIGLRTAREHLRDATADEADAPRLMAEFDRYAEAIESALAPLARV